MHSQGLSSLDYFATEITNDAPILDVSGLDVVAHHVLGVGHERTVRATVPSTVQLHHLRLDQAVQLFKD